MQIYIIYESWWFNINISSVHYIVQFLVFWGPGKFELKKVLGVDSTQLLGDVGMKKWSQGLDSDAQIPIFCTKKFRVPKNGDHFFLPTFLKHGVEDICFEQLSPLSDILDHLEYFAWIILGRFYCSTGPIFDLSGM